MYLMTEKKEEATTYNKDFSKSEMIIPLTYCNSKR